jgi:hypothetical protein
MLLLAIIKILSLSSALTIAVQGELLEQREPTSALDWLSRDKSQQS